jgi:hypothetical protein
MSSENTRCTTPVGQGVLGRPAPARQSAGLIGRGAQCRQLDQLLSGVRAGHSGALVVRGETGIGTTALLDYLATHSPGCRVQRTTGIQSELELPFAGLHQLCQPVLGLADNLAAPDAREWIALAATSGSPRGELVPWRPDGLSLARLQDGAAYHFDLKQPLRRGMRSTPRRAAVAQSEEPPWQRHDWHADQLQLMRESGRSSAE